MFGQTLVTQRHPAGGLVWAQVLRVGLVYERPQSGALTLGSCHRPQWVGDNILQAPTTPWKDLLIFQKIMVNFPEYHIESGKGQTRNVYAVYKMKTVQKKQTPESMYFIQNFLCGLDKIIKSQYNAIHPTAL